MRMRQGQAEFGQLQAADHRYQNRRDPSWAVAAAPKGSSASATACAMNGSAVGLLLLGRDLKPIDANAEAVEILTYPEAPESIAPLDGLLAHKIQSVLLANGVGSQFAPEFISGRRRYRCRTFSLNARPNRLADHPAVVVILERLHQRSFDASQVAALYQLTPREQETLEYLKQGLTNKEIGNRMNISPNTVKAFLKVIMIKMGVSTRSGVIGKAIDR
ncbi:MAG: hypothetical protein DMG57_24865 [Acidobacteria bacterium]|nr:MAG: hypothetical protein DMG57_24865 [Acidobacteriota bacterium]